MIILLDYNKSMLITWIITTSIQLHTLIFLVISVKYTAILSEVYGILRTFKYNSLNSLIQYYSLDLSYLGVI